MKYYNPNELFLARIGNVYTHNDNLCFDGDGFGLFTKYRDNYIDIFSNQKYNNFQNRCCRNGEIAINSPRSLVVFAQTTYKDSQKIDNLKNIMYNIVSSNKVSELELKELLLMFNGKTTLKKSVNSNIKIYSELYKKKYKLNPCIERGKELNELICSLSQKNTTPILVGEHGTGKTTIVDGLVYRIQRKNISKFLLKQKILELDIANLIGTNNKEEQLINLISYCIKNNIILFIDDIEKLVDLELYDIVKESIKRKNLKIISSTTIDNYNKYFWDDDFTKILIDEPDNQELNKIIREVICNYAIENHIIIYIDDMDTLIKKLIELTNRKNRNINTNIKIEDDKSYNPYLICKIIDKMFAHAIANNQKNLTKENILYAINSCTKINEQSKNIFITDIENLYIDEKVKRKTI